MLVQFSRPPLGATKAIRSDDARSVAKFFVIRVRDYVADRWHTLNCSAQTDLFEMPDEKFAVMLR